MFLLLSFPFCVIRTNDKVAVDSSLDHEDFNLLMGCQDKGVEEINLQFGLQCTNVVGGSEHITSLMLTRSTRKTFESSERVSDS